MRLAYFLRDTRRHPPQRHSEVTSGRTAGRTHAHTESHILQNEHNDRALTCAIHATSMIGRTFSVALTGHVVPFARRQVVAQCTVMEVFAQDLFVYAMV